MHPFSTNLFLDGRATVTRTTWLADQLTEQRTLIGIEDLEVEYRLTLPGTPPQVDHGSLLWAAKTVAWAAGVLVDRDQSETRLPETLCATIPNNREPSAIYSVDLLMRFLPSMIQRTLRIDRDDPLLKTLGVLAKQWPLSSVGYDVNDGQIASADLIGIQGHSCLQPLYVDRIICYQDRSRLDEPWVDQSVRQAVGNYPDLTGGLFKD